MGYFALVVALCALSMAGTLLFCVATEIRKLNERVHQLESGDLFYCGQKRRLVDDLDPVGRMVMEHLLHCSGCIQELEHHPEKINALKLDDKSKELLKLLLSPCQADEPPKA